MNQPTVEPTVEKTLKNDNPRHELSYDERVKGGQSRTLKRRMTDQFKFRRYCTETCPIFEACWARELVYVDTKYKEAGTDRFLCALKGFSQRLQNSTINVLLKEDDGFKRVMKDLILRLLLHTDMNNRLEIGYAITKLGFVMDKLYGQKHRTEISSKASLNEEFIAIVERSMQEENQNKG